MFVTDAGPARVEEAAVAASSPAAGRHRPARSGRRRRIPIAPYLYVLPAIALLGVWIYRPLVETFQLSFFSWNLLPTQPLTPVGLQNYASIVASPQLHNALVNTGVYIAAFLVFSVVLPIAIALISRTVGGRAKTVYQAIIFVPFLVTPVAAAAVWRWLLSDSGGAIPTVLRSAGIDIGDVLRSPSGAIWAIIAIVGWQMLGFGVLVVSAGIAGINPDYAHAAAIDGAGGWTILRRITLPLLSPTIVFLVLMTILLSAQWTYPMIDILTQGGPSDSTTNVYYLLYQIGFQNFDAGTAGAAGTLFFIVFGLIALGLVALSDRLSFYDN
ncbi:carbohydrate ABC transporter permease [Leifsonia sp. TF02-11]|uniref:carbohydrate ABC transporter permease n=1 Tax=Leifsonia sp. TF02-11 TaxID=2815212 RepID=UPI001AA1C0B7|nr:sugar ABC transporter permease [Leifsonia sp. TF02-11]MBO1741246.1 sugar ABC transporter permease [Leifsonia sp. TF02-11]